MNKLPEKPSDLITLALDDLEKVEADPLYSVEMGTWHEPNSGGWHGKPPVCEVCFAGAVMAKTLPVREDHIQIRSMSEFSNYTRCRLYALDSFMRGDINAGLGHMQLSLPEEFKYPWDGVHQYHVNPSHFKQDMRDIADSLKEVGL